MTKIKNLRNLERFIFNKKIYIKLTNDCLCVQEEVYPSKMFYFDKNEKVEVLRWREKR